MATPAVARRGPATATGAQDHQVTRLDRAIKGRPRPAIVADELRERLLANEWPVGGQLPAESALASHYGVSRVSIRTALKSLEEAGLIRIQHGRGSFVTQLLPSIGQNLDELRSMTATIRNAGHRAGSKYHHTELRLPSGEERARLKISSTTPVWYVEREFLADGEVVVFCYAVINTKAVPENFNTAKMGSSFFEYLATFGVVPEYALADIRPVLSTDVGWGAGRSPAGLYLLLDQVTFLEDESSLDWSRFYFVEDRFHFTILRRR
jgi:GntR family transcriptional regulator